MAIDNLPIISNSKEDLKVIEKAEITFKDGGTVLAYVAGRTIDGLLIYDSSAARKGKDLYIEFNFYRHEQIKKIKNYMPLRRLMELV